MRNALLEVIERHWGYSSFRPLQKEAMTSVLEDRDSLVVLPTGGGKSLCYQAPALLRDGVTVVVSPLISLMKDQVDALVACGVAAAQMNSSQSSLELRALDKDLQDGKIRLLFVSPERLALPAFRKSLRQAGAAAFAIDEAHCISHWGHDFRPDYMMLGSIADRLDRPPIVALTATAGPDVQADIIRQLRMREPFRRIGELIRPNLLLEVQRTVNQALKDAALEKLLGETDGTGIIYVATVKEAARRLVGTEVQVTGQTLTGVGGSSGFIVGLGTPGLYTFLVRATGTNSVTFQYNVLPGLSVTSNAPASYPLGSTTVVWTASDGVNPPVTCEQTVTVVDAEAPAIACPASRPTVSSSIGTRLLSVLRSSLKSFP